MSDREKRTPCLEHKENSVRTMGGIEASNSQSTMASTSQTSAPPRGGDMAPRGPTTQQQQQQKKKKEKEKKGKVGIRERIQHFTFAWFLCTMSTGGLSIALSETPHQFHGLHTMGLMLFCVNVGLFALLTGCMVARAMLYPGHVCKAVAHPGESFFVGSFWLSASVVVGGVQVYGITRGPGYRWLMDSVHVLYWVYAGVSLANAVLQYFVLVWRSRVRPVPFTPSMFLPGYSAMLTGTLASLIAPFQLPARAYGVLLSGLAFQGLGWLISSVCMVYFVRLLLDQGFPPPALRPALFIPVGSVAYTIVALVGLANAIPQEEGYFAAHAMAKEMCHVISLMVSVFLWLFSFWLFCIAVLGNLCALKDMHFGLSWWAFIFPNVGFMLATNVLGQELQSQAILCIASVLTISLVAVWLVATVACVRAVWKGDVVWPGKDEDKDV
ncbi:hypothetical protein ACEQ8H_006887 [Pleosporales sp. CAS-2024a]